MKSAFTLIEILVSMTILALISGGGLVYLNNFNTRQALNKSKDDVVSSIKLARSYAKTRQVPFGSAETELKYVQFQMVGKNLVAGANGIGSTFFNMVATNNSIGVSSIPVIIYFWGGNGFLAKDSLGTMFGVGETVSIFVQSRNNLLGYYRIIVNDLGQINSTIYYNGIANEPTPTPLPPTITPTTIPTATPTVPSCRVGGIACSVHGQCCSYYCSLGSCLAEPTPTPPCLLGGNSCSVHGQCCSYYCSSSKCQ